MSDFQDIRRALEKKLNAMAGVPSIAWENSEFDPKDEETWVRARFTVAEMRPATVGINYPLLYQGLFLVDCFGLRNKGTSALDLLADSVVTEFAAGQQITENSKVVNIRFAERAGALFTEPWYHVPVTITWYSYITP